MELLEQYERSQEERLQCAQVQELSEGSDTQDTEHSEAADSETHPAAKMQKTPSFTDSMHVTARNHQQSVQFLDAQKRLSQQMAALHEVTMDAPGSEEQASFESQNFLTFEDRG